MALVVRRIHLSHMPERFIWWPYAKQNRGRKLTSRKAVRSLVTIGRVYSQEMAVKMKTETSLERP